MNDAYNWPIRVVTDYDDDRVSISEGSLRHIRRYHPNDTTEVHVDSLEQVLVSPDGGVYKNRPGHDNPHRLNYYSAPVDTEDGPALIQVIVDKVECDPAKVITAYVTDRIGSHGDCIRRPVDGGES